MGACRVGRVAGWSGSVSREAPVHAAGRRYGSVLPPQSGQAAIGSFRGR